MSAVDNTSEKIREINQQSIDLSSDWIDRLKQVQLIANKNPGHDLPEIVMATVPHVKPFVAHATQQPVAPTVLEC